MEIPITPEIVRWIESNRNEMRQQPEAEQWFDPGFQQVIDAYDRETAAPLIGDKVRLSGGNNPKAYDGRCFYVTSVDEKLGLTLVLIGGTTES